jgi:ABC-type dipeptide/oligopeptide/nickel transport system permease subunit
VEKTTTSPVRLTVAAPETTLKHRTLWQDAARRFFKNRLAIFGLVIVLLFLFLAIFADMLAPYPYDYADFTKVLLFPFTNPAHPLGTDDVGRDYLSRLIYGARTSMTVGLSVQLIALLIGIPLGWPVIWAAKLIFGSPA